jgi:hypothetical protein
VLDTIVEYINLVSTSADIGYIHTWILHESEAFICKALKGKAIVAYAEPLITPQMNASGSPALLGRS